MKRLPPWLSSGLNGIITPLLMLRFRSLWTRKTRLSWRSASTSASISVLQVRIPPLAVPFLAFLLLPSISSALLTGCCSLAGLRGAMKAGFAHMNVLTVVQASQVCFVLYLFVFCTLPFPLHILRFSSPDCEVIRICCVLLSAEKSLPLPTNVALSFACFVTVY